MARTSSSDVGNEMLEASPDERDSSRPYSSNSSVKGLIVADMQNSPLANYSVCREMLPHRFVDVFETVSIIEDFYVRAIRRAAMPHLGRQMIFYTYRFAANDRRNWRSKNVEVFYHLLPATMRIRQVFGQLLVK